MSAEGGQQRLSGSVRFAGFELDPAEFALRQQGVSVHIEPQCLAILTYFVQRPQRLVTRDELLDEIWGHRYISDSAVSTQIKALRQVLGDTQKERQFIETVRGRGFRFVAEVVSANAGAANSDSVTNLGPERTPLFGRESLKADVRARLGEHRLVSLLGLGGVGKTRLAKAVGRDVIGEYSDGVCWLDLVPVRDMASLVTTVAHGLKLALGPDEGVASLAARVRDRQLLLILDNCEHVIEQVVAMVDHLLDATSRLRVLATCRVPLRLPDEHRLQVPPLPVAESNDPGAQPAVGLFAAAALRHGIELRADDIGKVHELCQALDGLPLALELAAAQLRIFSVAELQQQLGERLRFQGTDATAPPDRSNLNAVLMAMWQALSDDDRELMGRLLAFAASFTATDAQQLSQHLPFAESFARLADCSLVVRDEGRSSWRVLETVKLFIAEHTPPPVRAAGAEAHALWALRQLNLDENFLRYRTADWCETHYLDVQRARHHFAATERLVLAAELSVGTCLSMHFDIGARAARTITEIEGYLEAVDEPRLLTWLHIGAVFASQAAHDPQRLVHHGTAAVTAAKETQDLALQSLAHTLGSWGLALTDPEQGLRMIDDAVALARQSDHSLYEDLALAYRAWLLAVARRFSEARPVCAEIVERRGAEADETYALYAAMAGSIAAADVDNIAPARAAMERLAQSNLNHWGTDVLSASILSELGESSAAAELCWQVYRRVSLAGVNPWPDLLVALAALACACGEPELAGPWLNSVKHSRTPTRSFMATVAYRRMRDRVALASAPAAELAETSQEALAWLSQQLEKQNP